MKKYILILLMSSFLWSCEDYLKVEPTNVIALKTFNDLESLMAASLRVHEKSGYDSKLKNVSPFYDNMSNYLVVQYYSDDLLLEEYLENWKGRNNRGMFYKSLNWQYENIPDNIWKICYLNIGFYNTILDELKKLSDYTVEQGELIKGEAKYLRAWNLFKLMQYYSPYKSNIGIPLNFDPEKVSTYDKKRKTSSEVYKIIIEELTEILNYKTKPTDFSKFYDKRLINALLAKVYHYKAGSGAGVKEDWTNAIAHAQKALEGKQMLALDKFDDLFKFEKTGFFKDSKVALLANIRSSYNKDMGDIVGKPSWGINQYASNDLYALYTDKDIRKTKYFGAKKQILKFTTGLPYSGVPYLMFRLADLKLIIAESYARSGDTGNAKKTLEEFQAKRIADFTGYTGSNVLAEILNERRREFCYEYDMRWIDIRRTEATTNRPALDVKDKVVTYKLIKDDYRKTFPIPRIELEYNKIDQNPGWSL